MKLHSQPLPCAVYQNQMNECVIALDWLILALHKSGDMEEARMAENAKFELEVLRERLTPPKYPYLYPLNTQENAPNP